MSMRYHGQYNQPIPKPDIRSALEREGVELRQRGKNFWALCPLHSERTPSFKVDLDRQTFYCFGCQKHGDVITFVMLLHGFSFKDALRYLCIDNSGYKPDPLMIYTSNRKKARIESFRAWEQEMRDLLAYLLRMSRRQIAEIKTESELERWASLIRDFSYYEYMHEILCGRDDRSKYELFKQEEKYAHRAV